jgi:hypothetical protein
VWQCFRRSLVIRRHVVLEVFGLYAVLFARRVYVQRGRRTAHFLQPPLSSSEKCTLSLTVCLLSRKGYQPMARALFCNTVSLHIMKCNCQVNVVFTYLISEPGSSVSTVSGYGLHDRAIEVGFPAGAKDFSSSLCAQTVSGTPHPASCQMGYRG